MEEGIFFKDKEIKQKYNDIETSKPSFKSELNLTIKDVKHIALLKYGSVAGFGRKLGVTVPMASRLLSGGYIPLKPVTIHRIADVLGIDAVILALIYKQKLLEEGDK